MLSPPLPQPEELAGWLGGQGCEEGGRGCGAVSGGCGGGFQKKKRAAGRRQRRLLRGGRVRVFVRGVVCG